MQLLVTTLTGKTSSWHGSEGESVFTLKCAVALPLEIPSENQRLLFNDTILSDEALVGNCGLDDGDTLVVLDLAKPERVSESPQLEVTKDDIDKATALYFKDSDDSETITNVSRQLNDLISTFSTFRQHHGSPSARLPLRVDYGGAVNPDADGSHGTPEDAPLEEPIVELEKLGQLLEMGFPEPAARKALLLNNMAFDRAVDWLLRHADDGRLMTSLTQAELRALRRLHPNLFAQTPSRTAVAPLQSDSEASQPRDDGATEIPEAVGEGDDNPSQAQPLTSAGRASSDGGRNAAAPNPSPPLLTPPSTVSPQNQGVVPQGQPAALHGARLPVRPRLFRPNPQAMALLQDMGFSRENALVALHMTNNDVDAATAALLDDATLGSSVAPPAQATSATPAAQSQPAPGPVPPPAHSLADRTDQGLDGTSDDVAVPAAVSSTAVPLADGDQSSFEEHIGAVTMAMLQSPMIQNGLGNRRIVEALQTLVENPGAVQEYTSDPEIGPVLFHLQGIIQEHLGGLAPPEVPTPLGPGEGGSANAETQTSTTEEGVPPLDPEGGDLHDEEDEPGDAIVEELTTDSDS